MQNFTPSPQTEAFLAEARDWAALETPYRKSHATKGQGCDCVGLLRGLATKFDLPCRQEPYAQDPVGDELIEELSHHLTRIPTEQTSPGDIIACWVANPAVTRHVLIVDLGGYIIHASALAGKVVRERCLARWLDRINAAFRVYADG